MDITSAVGTGRRPLGIAVIAIFLVLDAVFAVAQVVTDSPFSTRTETLADVHEWFPGLSLAFAALRVVVAIGLWRGMRWAWVLTMLVLGIGLFVSLVVYWLGDPAYARMAIDVVAAFYLNQGDVRHFFQRPRSVVAERPVS